MMINKYLIYYPLCGYSKNPRVRTYIFPSLAKQVLIFGGSYWQFRLKWVLNWVLKFSVETIPVQAEKLGLVLYDTAFIYILFIYNCLVMSLVQRKQTITDFTSQSHQSYTSLLKMLMKISHNSHIRT